jgi:hypothetical protein
MSTPNQLKPRVMWANYYRSRRGFPVTHPTLKQAEESSSGIVEPVRVVVVPLDDVEAIVEQAAKVLFKVKRMGDWEALHETGKLMWRHSARSVLTAAGIPCKRKARK